MARTRTAETADDTEIGSAISVPITDVSELTTFDDVARTLIDSGTEVVSTADLADGYTLLKDKDQLVGSEFFIVGRTIRMSEAYGSTYSIIRIITKATNSRVIITDGSTGIHAQLGDLPEDRVIYCANGLVRSDYEANDVRPAGTTYYLDTSGGKLPVGTL